VPTAAWERVVDEQRAAGEKQPGRKRSHGVHNVATVVFLGIRPIADGCALAVAGVTQRPAGLVFSEPKNASRRTADLPQRAVEALRSHRKRQVEDSLEQAPTGRIMASCSPPAKALPWTLRT
jgi:hypothetical protein